MVKLQIVLVATLAVGGQSRVQDLVRQLATSPSNVQRQVMDDLLALGPERCTDALDRELAKFGVPAVAELLDASDVSTAQHAAWVLGELGSAAASAAPALRQAIHEGESTIRAAVAAALARISPQDSDVILSALLYELAMERYGVLEDLTYLGHRAKPAVPAIARALDHPDVQIARSAALALANLGPTAQEAQAQLISATGHPDHTVRWYALLALGRCGCVPISFQHATLTEDDDAQVRAAASVAAWFAAGGAASPVENLLLATQDSNAAVRETAVVGLGAIWQLHESARDAVRDALADPDENVRLAAWEISTCPPR